MPVAPPDHDYPEAETTVGPLSEILNAIFVQPAGLIEDVWPPTQLSYLRFYLERLGCTTVVVEFHYIDRDFVDDFALFYSRSLRAYPNYCRRLHFFSTAFSEREWRMLFEGTAPDGAAPAGFLQSAYLGFSVVKPLPGSPVGRTVLKTLGSQAAGGLTRSFGGARSHTVNLAGFNLTIEGLAFQQQDRGVSACATTALWSALQKIAPMEGLAVPTPAAITQAASKYFLAGGRSLPSEGLSLDQIGEAARASGLAPLVIPGQTTMEDRAQLQGYLDSGFTPVLAIQKLGSREGHAVCAVGLKLETPPAPADPEIGYREAASAIRSVYVHDDRLGPYALADLDGYTNADGTIRSQLVIRWPDPDLVEVERSLLLAMIVPVPAKLRLTITRIRALGLSLAQWVAAKVVPQSFGAVLLTCRYQGAVDYRRLAFGFGLSSEGLYTLANSVVLSRYVGLISLSTPEGPLLEVLLDATETTANPSALALVVRRPVDPDARKKLEWIAETLGGVVIA